MMNNYLKIGSIFLMLLSLISCEESETEVEGTKIARVGNAYLYKEDLAKDIPEGISKEDSLSLIEQAVNYWIEEQVVLQKAEEVLLEEVKDVKDRLEKYRKSLVIYTYEQEFIKERLDTVVSTKAIEKYYSAHQQDFLLKDYIVKVLYLKVSKGTPELEKPMSLYKLKNEEDVNKMRYYADLYAVKFHYNPEQWLYFSDVLKEIPLRHSNMESFIFNKKKVMFEDDEFVYFLNVTDFMMKDAISPLSFEEEKIKTILINLRTTNLRDKLREDLYSDAKKAQQIEIYNVNDTI